MVKHLVLLKFKDGVTEDEISRLEAMLSKLPDVISEIREYQFGRDIVRSERSYDFGLSSSFDDLAALERYQKHPEHVKVLQLVKEITSNVITTDFEV